MNLLVKQLEMSAACLQMANRAFESNMRLAQVMMTSAFESAKLLSPVGPVVATPANTAAEAPGKPATAKPAARKAPARTRAPRRPPRSGTRRSEWF